MTEGLDEPDQEARLSFGYSFVAYLDLLGQSSLLRTLERLPRTEAEKRDVIQTLAGTALNVKLLRDSFTHHFRSGLLTEEGLSERAREVLRRVFARPPRFRGFSDSVVITVPLRAETQLDNVTAIAAVDRALLAIAAVQTNFLANSKTAIRGGIDVGLGIELEGEEYYGRALVEAYLLESEQAEFPRVLVGSGLVGYLKAIEDAAPSFDPHLAALALQSLGSCRQLLLPDPVDGRLAVDPMVVTMLDDGSGSGRGRALAEGALKRAEDSAQEWRALGNKTLVGRYGRLAAFLRSSPFFVAPEG